MKQATQLHIPFETPAVETAASQTETRQRPSALDSAEYSALRAVRTFLSQSSRLAVSVAHSEIAQGLAVFAVCSALVFLSAIFQG